MNPIWHQLDSNQIHYLVDILEHKSIKDYIGNNDWYKKFVDGVRFDILRKRAISENQLHQVKKLAQLANQPWRLLI